MSLRNLVSAAILSVRRRARVGFIDVRRRTFPVQHHADRLWSRYGAILRTSAFLVIIIVSLQLAPFIQALLEPRFSSKQEIESLRALLLSAGSALMGAAAIVTSLVLFALQVNIERMPHGLFRRLSADPWLLGAFMAAFMLAVGVATLSTFVEQTNLGYTALGASWGFVLILTRFRYAYGRALFLINPASQLEKIFRITHMELRGWARRAQRATLLFENQPTPSTDTLPESTTHDNVRTTYFDLDRRGIDAATKGLQHAMSFARRYAEQGDYEISSAALDTVVRINAAYIEAKAGTFYANALVIEGLRSTDSFIDASLEWARQSVQIGITRRDEQQIEQTLRCIGALAQLYLAIEYTDPRAEKTHANLGAAYLTTAVKAVIPHAMIDVLLLGERLIGQTAETFLAHGTAADLITLSNDLRVIASAGTKGDDYRPITTVGMEQFADLAFHLLLSKNRNVRSLANRLSDDVSRVATSLLMVADTHPPSVHRTCLEPYFSLTSAGGLRIRLTSLVNFLVQQPADNLDAQRIIRHIEQWGDGLYLKTRQVFLTATTVKSHFVFDMIQWIKDLTEILVVVSNASACRQSERNSLRNHAQRLIAIFTLTPNDPETLKFMEKCDLTEALFEAAAAARKHGCDELSNRIGQYLLSWTFKAGRNETGWGTLEIGLCAYAVLTLNGSPGGTDAIKSAVQAHLQGEEAPSSEVLANTARSIRRQAQNLGDYVGSVSTIESALTGADPETLVPLLNEIADICAGAS